MYLSPLSPNISVCTRVSNPCPTLNGLRLTVNWAGMRVASQSITCPEKFVCRSFSEGRIKDSDMEVTEDLYPRNFALESSIRVEESTWGLGDTTMLEDRVANSENAKQVISRKDCGAVDPSDSSAAASTREELYPKLPEANVICKNQQFVICDVESAIGGEGMMMEELITLYSVMWDLFGILRQLQI
jgi:hypothetical protein